MQGLNCTEEQEWGYSDLILNLPTIAPASSTASDTEDEQLVFSGYAAESDGGLGEDPAASRQGFPEASPQPGGACSQHPPGLDDAVLHHQDIDIALTDSGARTDAVRTMPAEQGNCEGQAGVRTAGWLAGTAGRLASFAPQNQRRPTMDGFPLQQDGELTDAIESSFHAHIQTAGGEDPGRLLASSGAAVDLEAAVAGLDLDALIARLQCSAVDLADPVKRGLPPVQSLFTDSSEDDDEPAVERSFCYRKRRAARREAPHVSRPARPPRRPHSQLPTTVLDLRYQVGKL
ncbi:hypothetical protein WJX72_011157 [[Myrmecia] bisecta]|uniref:Uncharacterized protein n=1 Tax=[Myrmecia] bisecta TaxID=41462 RepID=A0AAW1QCH7_9CHLO